MDRDDLSAAIIQEMGAVFMAALAEALPAVRGMDLGGMERHLRQMLRSVMGQVVERIVALDVAMGAEEPTACPDCGGRMRRVDAVRPRCLQGLVGDYTLRRAYDRCTACGRGHVPLDERLGLGPGALSPGLARVVCREGLEGAFAAAVDSVAEAVGVQVSAEVARQTTERLGAVAEAQVQAAMARAQQGHRPWEAVAPEDGPTSGVLAVEVDGLYVHRDADWHEMKVVTVAPLGPTCERDPDTERWRLRWGTASYGAGFEEAEDFWYRAYVEACRRGLGTAAVHTVVLLGDGAEWIWRQGRAFLALPGVEVVEIIDLYHAYEYLWALGNAVFGAEAPAAAAWVEPLKTQLYAEGAAPVQAAVAALAQTLGGTETATEEPEAGAEESAAVTAVRRARAYLATNAARLDYPAFVARQLPIGSGAVESAGKTVIQARTKGAGMRWSGAGAQAVVSLRTLHRSGRWAAFWQSQPQRSRLLLFPRTRATRTASPPVAAHPAPEPPRLPAGGLAADPPTPSLLLPASRPRPTPQQRPLLLPRSRSA